MSVAGKDAAAPNPLVAALLEGRAPQNLRLSAARGVLPLSKPELQRVWVALQKDEDAQVRTEAAARLAAIPRPELADMLVDAHTAPEVLHYYAGSPSCPSYGVDLLIANASTPTSALKLLLPRLAASQIDQVLMNQTRLLSSPSLLDLIEAHPAATPLHKARVEEFRRHFLAPAPRKAPSVPDIAKTPAPPDPATVTPPAEAAPVPADAMGDGEQPVDGDAVLDNATRRILRMNTAEKIQLAFKGTREERSILIKDASKSVQEAVIESPKLSENEVESISKMRSVTEDVLRQIAGNRDWSKNYTIVHALATNPKTPAGIAMNMVTRLNSRDLKLVVGDKNVSEVIRRHARKVVDSRNERSGGRPGH
jgi:hypothetical protein